MVPPRVCVSPTPSQENIGTHGEKIRNDVTNTAEPASVHRLRCSLPSLSPRCSMFREVSLFVGLVAIRFFAFEHAIHFIIFCILDIFRNFKSMVLAKVTLQETILLINKDTSTHIHL